jgi:TetR/AcrR family transcriptional repressor of lmrAB and yxaGH operons
MVLDTRRRMVQGAAILIGIRGASGTSLRDLAREAGVPLGSMYHHFPKGKQQLIVEAVQFMGDRIGLAIQRARGRGIHATVEAIANRWRTVLVQTDFRAGCTVMAVALEDDHELNVLADGIFSQWQESLAQVLREGGVDEERAPRLARMAVAAMEGGVALCRAEHSLEPLDGVLAELRELLAHAMS